MIGLHVSLHYGQQVGAQQCMSPGEMGWHNLFHSQIGVHVLVKWIVAQTI